MDENQFERAQELELMREKSLVFDTSPEAYEQPDPAPPPEPDPEPEDTKEDPPARVFSFLRK